MPPFTSPLRSKSSKEIYEIQDGKVILNFHAGQAQVWDSERRMVFMIAGSQGGKTSFGSWWLWREIQRRGSGDYLAVSSSYDLFKLKMLPEIRKVFEDILGIGRYWSGDKILELANPETGKFEANRVDDVMWGRIILRSATSDGGLESATAKAAWLDEVGQDDFPLQAWEAIRRRLTLNQGRVLGTTTPYNMGWLKREIVDKWLAGDDTIDVIQFASTANPSFPQEEFEYARKNMPEWKFKMFYCGLFEKPAGMIYNSFNNFYFPEGGHKVKPFDIPPSWPVYVGVDFGAVNTSTLWLAHDTEADKLYCFRATLEGNKSSQEHVQTALDYATSKNLNVQAYFGGAKSEKQQRMDWTQAGAEVQEPPISDVEAGIDKVIGCFKTNKLLIFDSCVELVDEIMNYSREVDPFGQPTEKIKDKNKYHRVDALRYGIAGSTVGLPMITVDSAPDMIKLYRGGIL